MSNISSDMEKVVNPVTSRGQVQDKRDSRTTRTSRDAQLFTARSQNVSTTRSTTSESLGRHPRSSMGSQSGRRATREINQRSRNSQSGTTTDSMLGFYFEEDYNGQGRKQMNDRPPPRLWRNFNSRRVEEELTFYNKEQFIQANCQFVVGDNVDLSVHLIDPDILVEWSEALQVRIMSHEVPQCPICLYPPTVPRMTKCGHIYCWACSLQYIQYENEKKSKKCAICCEHIYPDDLKSVVAKSPHNFVEGDKLSLVLMRIDKGFTQASPVKCWTADSKGPVLLDSGFATGFSKLLVANRDQQRNILDAERSELLAAQYDEPGLLAPYLEMLIAKLSTDIEALQDFTSQSKSVVNNDLTESPNPQVSELVYKPSHTALKSYTDAFTEEEEDLSLSVVSVEVRRPEHLERQDSDRRTGDVSQLEPPSSRQDSSAVGGLGAVRRAKRTSASEESSFFFYQASDGQHIYLHSLNWKCLAEEYGSIENWPQSIEGKILQVEHLTMSAAIRKRYRYLSHVPLTCAVCVVELDLGPPLISRETISRFEGLFSKRRKERKEQEKRDKWLTKRKEREENNLFNNGMRRIASAMANIKMSEEKLVAEFDETDFLPLSKNSNVLKSSGTPFASSQPKSFAAMLQNKQRCEATPSLTCPGIIRPSPTWPSLCSASGAAACAQFSDEGGDSDSELNREFAPPTGTTLGEHLGSLMDAQLKNKLDKPNDPITTPGASNPRKNKKGRRGKEILLFST